MFLITWRQPALFSIGEPDKCLSLCAFLHIVGAPVYLILTIWQAFSFEKSNFFAFFLIMA